MEQHAYHKVIAPYNPFNAAEWDCLELTITSLKKAGREYLLKDAASKALGFLVSDLECLYFHLRENPVLFTGGSNAGGGDAWQHGQEAQGRGGCFV